MHPFGCAAGSYFHHKSRFSPSRRPHYVPGRSDSPSPVLTLACLPAAFLWPRKLKCRFPSTPLNYSLHGGIGPSFMNRLKFLQFCEPHQPCQNIQIYCAVPAGRVLYLVISAKWPHLRMIHYPGSRHIQIYL